ncbi:MAG: hypothetical protein H6595_11525 [Flavobacteriales bacterium]|nr:hypothetical protein [Flavobacteriales bacterium]MCB9168090.1 hypothetical protein [Flavobacteriales bacterium]
MRLPHFLLFLLAVPAAEAQVAHGGRPIAWGGPLDMRGWSEDRFVGLDREVLLQTAVSSMPGGERYGVQRFTSVDVPAQGTWTTTDDQRKVCRMVMRSPGAVMLSVQFDVFQLAPSARVYLYDTDRNYFIGGFTAANAQPDGSLATAVVPGDAVVIELVEPDPPQGVSHLHVASITHGFRDIFRFGEQGYLRDYDPGYQSAACHNNVTCPIASDWQDQKRGVAMFLRPDGDGCTGTLINNTLQDGTPYFYMANHCYVATTSQWVFYFNYESPSCVGSSGPTNQTISGATLKSNYYFDDFVLLELNSTPPQSYGPYYNGWDHSGSVPQTETVIHHPLYDVKKITFDYQPATSYTVVPYSGAPETVKCWKSFWDSGIVEPVSSGSPMFDQNKRVIGHMYDGSQTCANASSVYTGCPKFSESWDGSSASTRLRDWLDPANSTTALDGYDPYMSSNPEVLVRLKVFLEGPYNSNNNLMNGTLRSSGLVPLAEPYTGIGYPHVGGGGESTTQGVLNASGTASVVDWVVLELRNKNDASQVLATRSALLLRNGSIVDVDGSSDVPFPMPVDDYYIGVHHRNHLGIMTQDPQPLSASAVLIDLTDGSVPLNGGTLATDGINGRRVMVSGDVTRDRHIKYSGTTNDRDPILTRVGGAVPTATVNGYYLEDLNMDGVVRYAGTSNDRDIILTVIGGTTPTATRSAQLP